MFSVDDSFDVDDDVFLQVAMNVGYSELCGKDKLIPPKCSSVPCDFVNLGSEVTVVSDALSRIKQTNIIPQVSTPDVPSKYSLHPSDSLGLNASFLRSTKNPSTDGRVVSSEINRTITVVDGIPTIPNQPVTPHGQTVHVTETSSRIVHSSDKRFNFKPLLRTSPTFSLSSESISPVALFQNDKSSNKGNVLRNKQKERFIEVRNCGQELSSSDVATKPHPISRNISKPSGDDAWDSDLDLSLETTPLWKAGTRDASTVNDQQNIKNCPPDEICVELQACASSHKMTKHVFEHTDNLMKVTNTIETPDNSRIRKFPLHSSIQQENVRTSSVKSTNCELPNLNQPKTCLSELRGQNVVDITTPTNCSKGTPMIETPSDSSTSFKRKRKFPGPAGILPKLRANMSVAMLDRYKPAASPQTPAIKQTESCVTDSQVPSSQTYEDKFLDGPWQMMKQDLEPQAEQILQEFSLQAIIKKASQKLLPRSKVPIMCVLIDQISFQNAEASAILRDPSGEMMGTIHRMVVQEYCADMHAGTVLVLRQVGVFSPSMARNHYLNITPNNLVRFYTREDSTAQAVATRQIANFEEDDFKMPLAMPATPLMPTIINRRMSTPLMNHTPRLFSHQSAQRSSLRHQGSVTPRVKGDLDYPSPLTASGASVTAMSYETNSSYPRTSGIIQRTPVLSSVNNVQIQPRRLNSNYNMIKIVDSAAGKVQTGSVKLCAAASHNNHGNPLFNIKSSNKMAHPGTVSKVVPIVSHPSVTSVPEQSAVSVFDNLWQDDQLNDLLSDLGDELLTEF